MSRLLCSWRRSWCYEEAKLLITYLSAAFAASARAGFGATLLTERMAGLLFTRRVVMRLARQLARLAGVAVIIFA